MMLKEQFLTLARAYAEREGISLGRLSSRIFNDGKKIPALADDADLTTARFEKGVQYLAERWPADMAWPVAIAQPASDQREVA